MSYYFGPTVTSSVGIRSARIVCADSTEANLAPAAPGRPDDAAFADAIETLRAPLMAHCYRMLGSAHDAEDALQEALLRAWRALSSFDRRRSFRPWLYRIATNVCLDAIAQRPRRGLPVGHGFAASPHESAGEAILDPVWLDPIASQQLSAAVDQDAPDARFEQRETLELAFLAVLQHLPAKQRAALLLCEVLAFSALEAAHMLDSTPASINSALQRARATLERKLPSRSQRRILSDLGDTATEALVSDYVQCLESGDVTRLAHLLAEDVKFSMPPFPAWWQGRDTVLAFTAADDTARRFLPLSVNGQLALGGYRLDAPTSRFLPELLEVLALDEQRRITEITAFVGLVGPCASDDNEPPNIIQPLFARLGLPPAIASHTELEAARPAPTSARPHRPPAEPLRRSV